jgi:hypothetical protein
MKKFDRSKSIYTYAVSDATQSDFIAALLQDRALAFPHSSRQRALSRFG